MNHMLSPIQIRDDGFRIPDSAGCEYVYSEVLIHAFQKLVASWANIKVQYVAIVQY